MESIVWNKYLPVLRILLKRSLSADQMFALNVTDFERLNPKRKTAAKFVVEMHKGRPRKPASENAVAAGLVASLQSDPVIRELLAENEFHIGMDTKYRLSVKHIALQPSDASENKD